MIAYSITWMKDKKGNFAFILMTLNSLIGVIMEIIWISMVVEAIELSAAVDKSFYLITHQ